jgi:uncharacterized protein YcbK (DUF882 family)
MERRTALLVLLPMVYRGLGTTANLVPKSRQVAQGSQHKLCVFMKRSVQAQALIIRSGTFVI